MQTIGLIQSEWGGTRIEPWSLPEGLDKCEITHYCPNPTHPERCNHQLFNAMINPLTKFSIYGVLWYQGESNGLWNRDKYGCAFTEMIKNWRRIWSSNTATNPEFPFGFMQLASYDANNPSIAFAALRWYQTNGYGYVPNESMKVMHAEI